MEIIKIVTLSFSALLLLFVGTSRLFAPVKTYLKNSGIQLTNEVNLLNEIRGLSGVMLCAGVLIALGIFFPSLTFTSFVVGALIFLGFLLGRVIGTQLDGKPNKLIIQGMVFELVLGVANIYGLLNALV